MSRKGAKSRTHGRKLRSTGTKARTRVGRGRHPRADLEKKLEAHARELERKLDARTRELGEARKQLAAALEQETASSNVLSIIANSPGALEPVFEGMLANAVRICEASFGNLLLSEGTAFRVAAMHGAPLAWDELRRREPVIRFGPKSPLARFAATRKLQHIADIRKEEAYLEREQTVVAFVEMTGARTVLAVPMLKENELIGGIAIYRQEVRPFIDKQIELVKSFAAQAVIAIENTRLLNELRESLQQQTATADVLKVISRSTFDLQAVLNTLTESAARLCRADRAAIRLARDGSYPHVASFGFTPEERQHWEHHSLKPDRRSTTGRAVLAGKAVHIVDIKADPELTSSPSVGFANVRTVLGVPMLREGFPVGVLTLSRRTVEPFTDKQIELATTFADQAVIAIENVRLFDEVQARTRELTEALEQRTATSEVLQVISSSPGELEPVFNAMLANAQRICEAKFGFLWRIKDGNARIISKLGIPPALAEYLQLGPHRPPLNRPGPLTAISRVVQSRQTVHIADCRGDPSYLDRDPLTVAAIELGGLRTLLLVPMLKDDELMGAIGIYRQEVRPFTDKQIELVQSFASQAVIAIENTRLLNELRESLQQQTATADVLKVISRSTFDLQAVLDTLAHSAARLCEAEISYLWRRQAGNYVWGASYGMSAEQLAFVKSHQLAPERGSASGRAALDGKIIHIPDVFEDAEYTWWEVQKVGNFRAIVAVPLIREGVPIGVLGLTRSVPRPFSEKQIELLTTFADQAVIAIENVRLFDEIQDKSRQLAEASQHKSQFLANMSHELRTPLNAILGYAELILDNIYGDTPEKMREVLDRIQRNGRHLLGLINDVLDLSKIEAGQLNLSLADYSLKDVVQSVHSAVEALANEKRIALKVEVAPDLPAARGDERKLTQVLLNLVGNAIKFTDAGEVAIKAIAANGAFTVAVRDTGPGIAEAEQAKIFEEFQQAELVDHEEERRDWSRTGDCQAHHRIAWGAAVGRVEPGARIDVLVHGAD